MRRKRKYRAEGIESEKALEGEIVQYLVNKIGETKDLEIMVT